MRILSEPDPLADPSGADVGRKATILARWTGLAPNAEVKLEGLVPAEWAGLAIEELLSRWPDCTVEPEKGRYAPGPFVRRYKSLPFSANGALQ